VLEFVFLISKLISRPGSDAAAQENDFLYRKRRCCTAKPFPALEVTLLHSSIISCTANTVATRQNLFLLWK
jgi:hypothetical protein